MRSLNVLPTQSDHRREPGAGLPRSFYMSGNSWRSGSGRHALRPLVVFQKNKELDEQRRSSHDAGELISRPGFHFVRQHHPARIFWCRGPSLRLGWWMFWTNLATRSASRLGRVLTAPGSDRSGLSPWFSRTKRRIKYRDNALNAPRNCCPIHLPAIDQPYPAR